MLREAVEFRRILFYCIDMGIPISGFTIFDPPRTTAEKNAGWIWMKKGKTRVILLLFLLAAVVCSFPVAFGGRGRQESMSLAGGCVEDYGDTGGLELPIVDKPLKVTCIINSENPDRSNRWVVGELEKRTGIKLEIQAVPPNSYSDRLEIILASGDLPDILYGVSKKRLNALGPQGVFAPINLYMDQLPNFRKIVTEGTSETIRSLEAYDGNLYLWPYYEAERTVNHGFLYRKDIFDKHGIKPWENTEEFYQALRTLKGIYPDSLPYTSKNKEKIFIDWAYGWGLHLPMYYDEGDGKWKYAYTQPEFKDMADFIKRLYNEGLIDPQFLTDSQANWSVKMTQRDKSFVTYDWISRMDIFYEQVKGDIPEYNLRYGNPIGPVAKIRRLGNVGLDNISSSGLAVANNPNRLQALKLLDYATSPSGAELLTLGKEGVTYARDAEGKIYYPEFSKEVVSIKDLEERFGLFMMGVYTRVDRRSVYLNYSEKEQEAQDNMIRDNRIEDPDPAVIFSKDEQNTLNELSDVLQKLGNTFTSSYIIDKSKGDADWREWIGTAEASGAKKLESIYNTAYERTRTQQGN